MLFLTLLLFSIRVKVHKRKKSTTSLEWKRTVHSAIVSRGPEKKIITIVNTEARERYLKNDTTIIVVPIIRIASCKLYRSHPPGGEHLWRWEENYTFNHTPFSFNWELHKEGMEPLNFLSLFGLAKESLRFTIDKLTKECYREFYFTPETFPEKLVAEPSLRLHESLGSTLWWEKS